MQDGAPCPKLKKIHQMGQWAHYAWVTWQLTRFKSNLKCIVIHETEAWFHGYIINAKTDVISKKCIMIWISLLKKLSVLCQNGSSWWSITRDGPPNPNKRVKYWHVIVCIVFIKKKKGTKEFIARLCAGCNGKKCRVSLTIFYMAPGPYEVRSKVNEEIGM